MGLKSLISAISTVLCKRASVYHTWSGNQQKNRDSRPAFQIAFPLRSRTSTSKQQLCLAQRMGRRASKSANWLISRRSLQKDFLTSYLEGKRAKESRLQTFFSGRSPVALPYEHQ